MKIVLIGAPGSGKGTLAQNLEKTLGCKHISVGKLMREEAKTNSSIRQTIDQGNLVDNQIIKEILKKRLQQQDCKQGFILDGYPRNLAQAQDLIDLENIDYVFYLQIPEMEVYNRLQNRLSCINCNAVYDKRKENILVCKQCGAQLEVRRDDTKEVIKHRLEVFNQTIKDVLKVFENKVIELSATKSPQELTLQISKILNEGAKKS